jgi:hypothetical protein
MRRPKPSRHRRLSPLGPRDWDVTWSAYLSPVDKILRASCSSFLAGERFGEEHDLFGGEWTGLLAVDCMVPRRKLDVLPTSSDGFCDGAFEIGSASAESKIAYTVSQRLTNLARALCVELMGPLF